MGKMTVWLAMMAGVTLLFYLGGIIEGTVTSTLLDLVLNPERFQTLDLMTKILSVSTLVIAAASTFVARNQNSDFYLMIPIVTILFTFGYDFLSVYQAMSAQGSGFGQGLALMLFGPIMIMYFMSVVEWWRGINP